MSYNPLTGLVYLPTIHMSVRYSDAGIDPKTWRSIPFVGGMAVTASDYAGAPETPYPASLQAWDPITQKAVWSVPQENYWNSGTLTTAGNLVFQGHANGHFVAYDARSGALEWDVDLGLGISAPPITYRLDGRQYITLLVGFGGGVAGLGGAANLGWTYGIHQRRLVAFSLEGEQTLPEQPDPYFPIPIDPPDFKIDPALAQQGAAVYGPCSACHGRGATASGMAPDLRASPIPLIEKLFTEVVSRGTRLHRGMPAYPRLGAEQLKALRHFIRQCARTGGAGDAGAR